VKLKEMFRPGVSDQNEPGADPMDPHSRSNVKIEFDYSFAHERGYDEAFSQLQQLPAFHAQLEVEFEAMYRRLAQGFISKSKIRPGYGWMDDPEVQVKVTVGQPTDID
jgi:hypothetical protein